MSRLDLRTNPFFQQCYRDFEGMADSKAILLKCRDPEGAKCGPTYKDGVVIDPTVTVVRPPGQWAWDLTRSLDDPPELTRAVRTIVLNLLYELADHTDIDEITFTMAVETCYAVREVLTCPEWVEVTDADIEAILNRPDEEEEGETND